MSTTVTVSGINYFVPLYGETGWAQGTGNLSQLLIALAAVSASSPAFLQTIAVSSTPVSLTTGHTYLVDTSVGAVTLNLPAPAANTWFMIKDVTGLAETNNITVHRFASELIDGVGADAILSLPNVFCILVSNGTNWFILLEI